MHKEKRCLFYIALYIVTQLSSHFCIKASDHISVLDLKSDYPDPFVRLVNKDLAVFTVSGAQMLPDPEIINIFHQNTYAFICLFAFNSFLLDRNIITEWSAVVAAILAFSRLNKYKRHVPMHFFFLSACAVPGCSHVFSDVLIQIIHIDKSIMSTRCPSPSILTNGTMLTSQ